MKRSCEPEFLGTPFLAPLSALVKQQENEAFPGRAEVLLHMSGPAPFDLLRQRAALHPMNLSRHLERMNHHVAPDESVLGQTNMLERWLNIQGRDVEIKLRLEHQARGLTDLKWSQSVLEMSASESWHQLAEEIRALRLGLERLDLGVSLDPRHDVEFAVRKWSLDRKVSEDAMTSFLNDERGSEAVTRLISEGVHREGLPYLHHIITALGAQLAVILANLEPSHDPEFGNVSPYSGQLALMRSRVQSILVRVVFELMRPYVSVWDYPLLDRDSVRMQALAADLVLHTLPLPDDAVDFFSLVFKELVQGQSPMGRDLTEILNVWTRTRQNVRELLSKVRMPGRYFASESQAWSEIFTRVREIEPLIAEVHAVVPVHNVFVSLASQVLAREWIKSESISLRRPLDGLRRLSSVQKLKRTALDYQCRTELAQCPPSVAHRIRFMVEGSPSGFRLLEQVQAEEDYLPRWGSERPWEMYANRNRDLRSDHLLESDIALVERVFAEFERGLELYEWLQVVSTNDHLNMDIMSWLDQMIMVFNARVVQVFQRPSHAPFLELMDKSAMTFHQLPVEELSPSEVAHLESLLRMGERIYVMTERLYFNRGSLEGRRILRATEEYTLLNTGYHIQMLRTVLTAARPRP